MTRFAAATGDPQVTAIADRLAAPLRVAVGGRRGVGRRTVSRALTAAGVPVTPDEDTAGVLVYVTAEVLKPEDTAALAAARRPVLVILNKADLLGPGAPDAPLAAARAHACRLRRLTDAPIEPMSALLAVAAIRLGRSAPQVRALLRRASGLDAVCDRIGRLGAVARYRRMADASAELEALAAGDCVPAAAVADFLAGDDAVIARMATAEAALAEAGPNEQAGTAAQLRHALRWRQRGCGLDGYRRQIADDIVRGSLRRWHRSGGRP